MKKEYFFLFKNIISFCMYHLPYNHVLETERNRENRFRIRLTLFGSIYFYRIKSEPTKRTKTDKTKKQQQYLLVVLTKYA